MFPFMYDGYGDYDNYGFGYGHGHGHGHGHRHGNRHRPWHRHRHGHGGIVNNLIVNVRDQYCYDNSGCFMPLP